jgi:hypothetical protein
VKAYVNSNPAYGHFLGILRKCKKSGNDFGREADVDSSYK